MSTDLTTLPEKSKIPAYFAKEKGVEELVSLIEKEARAIHQDYSTDAGRKAAKQLAAKVSRSKTLIDEVGKDLNEERLRLNKEVNAKRNLAKERLDALRDEIKGPAEAYEAKEAERVRLHLLALDKFDPEVLTSQSTVAELTGKIEFIDGTVIDDSWEEYEAEARAKKAAALDKYRADLAIAKSREDQQAELEALRAEKEERERQEAERKAKLEAAEREAKEAEKRAEAAERAAEAAKAAERQRIADEKAAEERRAAKLKADKAHRETVVAEIVAALTEAGNSYEALVEAMIDGKIPRVKVTL